jgi:uncharacterized protein YlbG (UPF0298 family)
MCSSNDESFKIIYVQIEQMKNTVEKLHKTFEKFIGMVSNGQSTLEESECFNDF